MIDAHPFSKNLQGALDRGVQKRLPLTFLPFVSEQLRRWQFLFPNERQSVERLLLFINGLTPPESSTLFYNVVTLEEKMGVRHWQFSTDEQTILNSSQLARSPFFQEWRKAVQAVFDAAEEHAVAYDAASVRNRLVVLSLPRRLPVKSTVWDRWQGIGKAVTLDLLELKPEQTALEALLAPFSSALDPFSAQRIPDGAPSADSWIIDAGESLVDAVLRSSSSANGPAADAPPFILLSYERLDAYRSSFSREMNTMRKDLADADAVFDRLRRVDVTSWCPPEVAASPAVCEYVRSLYLSGNGAVIFANSFVEWAASEAFRRARPAFLAAQFGTRAKPKAFTGVAVFDNADQINPAPSVDDLPGSALDAEMLSLYVWLAAIRFSEYQAHTACVCIAESLSQAYLVAPSDAAISRELEPIKLSRLGELLREWLNPRRS
jgi:hypothetical protein